ncbi:butanediol dehydrogenase [Rhodococcus sp. Eu-32]|uniref:alcohol dehydrogenase catalytic domain-containing protein n=1 Tax=Rhodococcus sp. Eu-32 TaxID=1017319 RepID=UPI000DF39DE9|nr:alcohol dehydrogenase catalytic domain-containing protein [Rhodococcus sp. Eu-32]RRQ29040.1 butanediol dehydrogenase [Rhodococcus sp. Eu-32]
MKALRYYGARDIRLDDIDEPEPGPGMVKVAVEAAGICGSDIHEYRGGPISTPVQAPHPLTGERTPIVLGHEFCGTVVAVGDGVDRIRVGQRVAANAALWCGRCAACVDGHTNVCHSIGFHGVSGGGGAFAAFDVISERNAHVVPDAVPSSVGALLEPLATAVHAVKLADVSEGDHAVVFGAGPLGLMVISYLAGSGPAGIVAVEPHPERAAAARRLGASTVIDPLTEDVVSRIAEAVGDGRVGASFDAAAAPDSLHTAIAVTGTRGCVINIAAWEKPIEFDPTMLLYREICIRGSLAYDSGDFEDAIAHAVQRVGDLSSLITSTIPLSDVVTAGFDRLAFERNDEIKVLVTP